MGVETAPIVQGEHGAADDRRAAAFAAGGRVALLAMWVASLGAFVVTALTRRLNFDESLALRAGWLLLEGLPAEPPFAMPVTLLTGALGHLFEDPGVLFPLLRSLVLASLAASAVWAGRRARLGGPVAAVTVAVCLLQPSFGVYAYEFRYDWALLVGWLLAYGLLQERRRRDFLLLGATIAWLGLHHVKGACFGAALYAVAWLALGVGSEAERGDRRARLLALHSGLLAVVLAWLGLALAAGFAGEVAGVYTRFVGLAGEQSRVFVGTALGAVLRRDAAWWVLALVGLVFGVRRVLASRDGWRREENAPLLFALLLAAPPLLFLLVHPRPWPYMLALPVPPLALLVARAAEAWIVRLPHDRRILAALALGALCLAGLRLGGVWPGFHFAVAMHAPSVHQIDSLRRLRALAAPGERVVDPSGLAWFQPPCTPQWYVDSLFHTGVVEGRWMTSLATIPAADCPWAVGTHRLGMLPEAWKTAATRSYRPAGGGLLLAAADPRHAALDAGAGPDHLELRSFWW